MNQKLKCFFSASFLLALFAALSACNGDSKPDPDPNGAPEEAETKTQEVALSCPCIYTKSPALTFGRLEPGAGNTNLKENITVSAQATAETDEEAKAKALEAAKAKAPSVCVEKHPGGTVDVSQCAEQQS